MACTVCGGKNDEAHEAASHEYTEIPGDIRPKKSKVPPKDGPDQPQMVGTTALGRLISVLHEKGVIDDADVRRVVGL